MNKHTSPDSSTSPRPYLTWLLWLLFVALVWLWAALPMWRIIQVDPDPKQSVNNKALPSKAFQKRIQVYAKAMRSPLIRPIAKRRIILSLTRNIYPIRIERSFRALLQKDSVQKWEQTFQAWDTLLQKLERQLPDFHIQAYRVYLYLQAGHFSKLMHWKLKDTPTKANTRLKALFHIWMGHAAFWSGYPQRALRHYTLVEHGFAQHPRWEHRSQRNWRLPSERSTVLHHIGLIRLWNKEPKRALQAFQTLEARWTRLRKKTHRSVDIYMARCLAAYAAMQANEHKRALEWLNKAGAFVGGTAQSTWQRIALHFASKNPKVRKKGLSALHKLASTRKKHLYTYTDTENIARLHLIARDFKAKHYTQGWKRLSALLALLHTRPLPTTLSVLARNNTFPFQFIPASPQLYETVLRHWPSKAIQKSLTKQSTKPTATSRPSSAPSSQPTSRTHRRVSTKSWTWTQARSATRILLSLAYLKRYDWKRAQQHLKRTLSEAAPQNKIAQQAHLYLTMLYLQTEQFKRGQVHSQAYRKAYPNEPIGALYAAYILRKKAPQKAWQQIRSLRKQYGWKRAVGTLSPTPKRMKKWRVLQARVGFWWRILGAKGMLTTHDTFLTRRTLFWQHRPFFRRSKQLQGLFKALRTSHIEGRFGLQTLLAHARILALYTPRNSKAHAVYVRQSTFIQGLYRRFPELSYIFDRTLYSHHLGTFALGFF